MKITTLQQAIESSLNPKLFGQEIDADLNIEIEDQIWKVYTVAISHRDILCYCDNGTATFLVDSNGDKHTAELFDYEKDGDL